MRTVVLLALLTGLALGEDLTPWRGVSYVGVVVSHSGPLAADEATVIAAMELQLRKAGLVCIDNEDHPPVPPGKGGLLELGVSTLEAKSKAGGPLGYAYSIKVTASIGVQTQEGGRFPAIIFTDDTFGIHSLDSPFTEPTVFADAVAIKIANLWLKDNPPHR